MKQYNQWKKISHVHESIEAFIRAKAPPGRRQNLERTPYEALAQVGRTDKWDWDIEKPNRRRVTEKGLSAKGGLLRTTS